MEIKNYNKNNENESTTRFNGEDRKFISASPRYIHEYEVFPYAYNSIVSMGGKIIDKQSYHKEASKHKVIYNGDTTIVILEDGSKGVAKCNPKDAYHKHTGYRIAKIRATIEKLQKELNEITKNCG